MLHFRTKFNCSQIFRLFSSSKAEKCTFPIMHETDASSSCSWRVRHVSCSLILKMKLDPPSPLWLSSVKQMHCILLELWKRSKLPCIRPPHLPKKTNHSADDNSREIFFILHFHQVYLRSVIPWTIIISLQNKQQQRYLIKTYCVLYVVVTIEGVPLIRSPKWGHRHQYLCKTHYTFLNHIHQT
jgi:hypothetical protein